MARFGLFPACSTIYRKRLIQPARSQIDVLLSDEDLIAEQPWAWVRNDEGLAHPNTPFQALPFIFGIRNYLVENKAYKGKATLAISSGRTKPSFRHYNPLRYLPITPQLVADQNRRGNDQWLAKKVIAKLQRAGKNGKAQVQWDPTGRGKHSFTSDTGELTMDFATGTLLINAPAAKGICGVQRSAQLGCATIDVKNPKNAYVLLVAMDGKPLDRSTSILLTALARAENTGMTWNQGRTKINIGKGPVILEPVRAKILLRRAKGAPALTLAAMKPDGKPKATLPMNRTDNRITFEVDGRRYKTIWYQLTASPPATQMKTE